MQGLGLDLVAIETVRAALERDADAMYAWLSEDEVQGLGERASSPENLAGRIAAKEAVVKSLGCGFDDEVAWQDITIAVDQAGAPIVHLTGGAASVAKRKGVQRVLISITHAGGYAAASACALA